MKITIIVDKSDIKRSITARFDGRTFHHTNSEREAHLYHIEHPEVDSYLLYADDFPKTELLSLVNHVQYLNPLVQVILISEKAAFGDGNLKIISTIGEIGKVFNELPEMHRDNNRVDWPVKVKFKKSLDDPKIYAGNILSLSSSGCYIHFKDDIALETKLIMTVYFMNFDFYTESKVVRRNEGSASQSPGIAVRFENTSPQTKKFIQSIIDEKILSDLMNKLNPDGVE